MEPEKPKYIESLSETEVTHEKRRRTKFQSREKKEEVIPPRIDGSDADVLQVSSNNHLLSHSHNSVTLFKGGKLASSSDTSSCELNIQKRGAATSDVSCTGSNNFVFSKTHGAVSRAGSKLEAQKCTEDCVQELCVNRKPRHAGLDPAELQQIIHDWDSDIEGDRNDEFSTHCTRM